METGFEQKIVYALVGTDSAEAKAALGGYLPPKVAGEEVVAVPPGDEVVNFLATLPNNTLTLIEPARLTLVFRVAEANYAQFRESHTPQLSLAPLAPYSPYTGGQAVYVLRFWDNRLMSAWKAMWEYQEALTENHEPPPEPTAFTATHV